MVIRLQLNNLLIKFTMNFSHLASDEFNFLVVMLGDFKAEFLNWWSNHKTNSEQAKVDD